MRSLHPIYRWFLRLLPIALGGLGWYLWHWPGMLAGLLVGAVLSIAIWIWVYSLLFKSRIRRQQRAAANLSTERLKELAADPTSPEMPYAAGELEIRGIRVRPSLESLYDLLTSTNANRRAYGFSLIFGLYPDVFAKLGPDVASTDAPEVWRARVAALQNGNS